jgi:hypothetical protein
MGPRARLGLAGVLFALWIGYLGFLAATTTRPVVLSRPQLLVSSLYVIADLKAGKEGPEEDVVVRRSGGPAAKEVKEGERLTILGLAQLGKDEGWEEPGEYILPLSRQPNGSYRITPTPRSPGYAREGPARQHIYRARPQALGQLRDIVPQ